MKKLFFLFLTLFVASSVWAYNFVVDGIYYDVNVDNSSVSVTYKVQEEESYEGSITIPSLVTYGGKTYNVTSIGYFAFSGCRGLTSITIPNSVTSIEYEAFYGCSGLKEVINLSSLKIEKGSSDNGYVARYADYVCNGEKKIVGDFIFGGNELVYYTGTSANVVLPENFEGGSYTIGSKAFANNTEIQSVTIPNSVTSIGKDAFYDCSGMTSLTIPESLDVSDAGIYFTKEGIRYHVLNSKEVELDGIKNEKSTGDLVIPQMVSAGNTFSVTSIGDFAFLGCSGLTSITIPNSVTSIGECAFEKCRGLTSVTIPNSVTSIGYEAFEECTGLTSVTIPESLLVYNAEIYFTKEGIRYHVIDGKEVEVAPNSYTGNIVIPSSVTAGNTFSVTSIGEGAFYGCIDLTSITIPNSVTSIEGNAFYGCSSLTSITIPNSVTSIVDKAFEDCRGLTSVTIPNSVTSIGGDAFSGCSGLTSVTIPESLGVYNAKIYFTKEGIRYHVHNGKVVVVAPNSYTGNIVIPSSITAGNTFSVTEIGDYAFSGCSGLTSVTIPNSVECIGWYAFEDCRGLTSVTIPNSVEWIGEKAFSNCSALSRVTCYAVNPPDAYASSFSNYNGYLTIPCDNFEAYDIHPIWGSFKHVDCISAESTELSSDEIVVEPEINEAVFSMPTNASANSYTLTIQSNGVTFCTLTFNNQGQLANIDFSNSQLKAAVEGYQFTVTGLSASTGYNYSFKALDKSKSVLKEYTGSFTTKNADGTGGSTTTAIENVELANAISIVNNQIFVNGEAPEFVITSLGQKVTNQNLKAGIYFVVVEGQNVSISIQ